MYPPLRNLLAAPMILLASQPIIRFPAAADDVVADSPSGADWIRDWSSGDVRVDLEGRTLFLELGPNAWKEKRAVVPRLCTPIRSIRWKDDSQAEIRFVPEPDKWIFSWKQAPQKDAVIEVIFEHDPVPLEELPRSNAAADGSILLHAYQARTFGDKLRYEPQWYKNTVGYWTVPTDYATWDLRIEQAGDYSVAVLQGCGRGQGGSEAVLNLREGEDVVAELSFETIDTAHFQNFRWNHLGSLRVTEAGDYQLRIIPKRIAKAALFDVRMIHLVKQAKAAN
jgi:hypothetical protein